MRKHLALVVEHENEDYVGGVAFYDSPKARLSKNEITPIYNLDDEKEDFVVVGKEVSVGYVDFEDEQAYKDWPFEELYEKLREIDNEWLEQAGIAGIVLSPTDTDRTDGGGGE